MAPGNEGNLCKNILIGSFEVKPHLHHKLGVEIHDSQSLDVFCLGPSVSSVAATLGQYSQTLSAHTARSDSSPKRFLDIWQGHSVSYIECKFRYCMWHGQISKNNRLIKLPMEIPTPSAKPSSNVSVWAPKCWRVWAQLSWAAASCRQGRYVIFLLWVTWEAWLLVNWNSFIFMVHWIKE